MKKIILITIAALLIAVKANSQYIVSSIPYNPYSYSGTPVLVSTDDLWSSSIPLPFPFIFFGKAYYKILIGSNGVVTFDSTNEAGYCAWAYTDSCPNPNLVNGSKGPYIFSPYHDIDPAVSGNITYAVADSAPYRKFIISWESVPMFSSSCNNLLATQQIVLYETSNDIDVNILNKPLCTSWNSGNAVIGIQDSSGTVGVVPPGRNTGQWTTTNEAWRFHTDFSLTLYLDNIIDATCNSSDGGISILVNGGQPPFTYYWNSTPSQITQNLSGVPAGNYCVTVIDASPDTATLCATVDTSTSPALTPDICLVTVDSTSGYNEIIWEKPVTTAIDKYIIYRETSIYGIYAVIGSQSYNNFSTYIDSSSIPLQQAYRYKIAYSDFCGDTSQCSPYHQTIHLAISPGNGGSWNLFWNDYLGFTFSTYNIYRGTASNNLTLLNALPYYSTSYTDLTPPSGTVYYIIEAVKPTACNPSLKSEKSVGSSISNVANTSGLGIDGFSEDQGIKVFPNPSNGFFSLQTKESGLIIISNSVGQVIHKENINNKTTDLDFSLLSRGLYFLELQTEKGGYYRKIMIE